MAGFNRIPAVNSGRGEHPDLTPDGYLRPEVFEYADPAARDFNVRFRNDPTWAANFMERIADHQRQQPEWIQETVAGQVFGEGHGTHAGVVEYQQELARLREIEDRYNHPDATVVVRDHEIADMPLERFDELFDSTARPREGVVVVTTDRSVRLDAGIDPHSAREFRSNRS